MGNSTDTSRAGEGDIGAREYFAAHAPERIAEWFQWERPKDLDPPTFPALAELTEEQRQFVKHAANEGYGREDLAAEFAHLWPHIETRNAWYRERDRRSRLADRARFIAWRWAYADAMLEGRKP